jgi:hypothetical protein
MTSHLQCRMLQDQRKQFHTPTPDPGPNELKIVVSRKIETTFRNVYEQI